MTGRLHVPKSRRSHVPLGLCAADNDDGRVLQELPKNHSHGQQYPAANAVASKISEKVGRRVSSSYYTYASQAAGRQEASSWLRSIQKQSSRADLTNGSQVMKENLSRRTQGKHVPLPRVESQHTLRQFIKRTASQVVSHARKLSSGSVISSSTLSLSQAPKNVKQDDNRLARRRKSDIVADTVSCRSGSEYTHTIRTGLETSLRADSSVESLDASFKFTELAVQKKKPCLQHGSVQDSKSLLSLTNWSDRSIHTARSRPKSRSDAQIRAVKLYGSCITLPPDSHTSTSSIFGPRHQATDAGNAAHVQILSTVIPAHTMITSNHGAIWVVIDVRVMTPIMVWPCQAASSATRHANALDNCELTISTPANYDVVACVSDEKRQRLAIGDDGWSIAVCLRVQQRVGESIRDGKKDSPVCRSSVSRLIDEFLGVLQPGSPSATALRYSLHAYGIQPIRGDLKISAVAPQPDRASVLELRAAVKRATMSTTGDHSYIAHLLRDLDCLDSGHDCVGTESHGSAFTRLLPRPLFYSRKVQGDDEITRIWEKIRLECGKDDHVMLEDEEDARDQEVNIWGAPWLL